MLELRGRQIHMDFHTSEKIKSIGEKFDAEQFGDTLHKAHVNSVTCFSRCHHGMLYYSSKKFPELVHPGLKGKNLLAQQIEACHKRKIKVPVYTTVQWDDHMSKKHPEWVCLNKDGSMVYFCKPDEKANVYEPGFYRTLCVNTGYRQYLKDQIGDMFEVIGTENVDGIFLDIVSIIDCSCESCVRHMLEEGYCPEIKEERIRYAKKMLDEFKEDMSGFIRNIKQEVSVFYNCGHVNSHSIDAQDAYTHWELESLPSGEWGYSHFINTARYVRTTGYDFLAHTGKFHTSWGDFHSFKNIEALQYECFRMLAYNSKCLIGDQLEPNGRISEPVYDLIGSVYSEVEKKEPWCDRAKAVCDIGVFTQEPLNIGTCGAVPKEVNGACTMLDEMGYQLDIVDKRTDFSLYKLLILPDTIVCDSNLAAKINDYVERGGALLVTGKAGLNEANTQFQLSCLGIEYIGEAPYSPDFLMPTDEVGRNLPKTEHVMYQSGVQIKPIDAEVLTNTYIPYFNRTWEHFCSHKHTPSCHEIGYPGITQKGKCIYFMHPVFTIYNELHPKWCKAFVNDAIKRVLPEPIVEFHGPSTMITTINKQEEESRYVVHLLHYIPVKACTDILTIEDIIPLYHIPYKVRVPEHIKSVKIVPKRRDLEFKKSGNVISFEVPEIMGHCMVELSY